ncbi:MAG: YihY family inner membrane protein [Phycisphaerae bacterium]|nr:YihY family inner membrane protein [Phycisphaerae bacterium]
MSAALSFRTIFAIIPVMILAFLLLKGAGMVDRGKEQLRHFLEVTGVSQIEIPDDLLGLASKGEAERPRRQRRSTTQPAATQPAQALPHTPAQPADGPPTDGSTEASTQPHAEAAAEPPGVNLTDKIITILDNAENKLTARRLGPVSLILVAWSAIALLTTLERSLNRIFEAPRSRPLAIRVLLYWSAVTFLPLLLVAMGTLTTFAQRTIANEPWLASAMVAADFFGTVLLGVAALTLIYKFLPHTPVNWYHAAMGAAIVVPVWAILKWGFQLYVLRVAGASLYGGLGVLPLFLIWLNLCWFLLLLGAAIAHALSNRASLDYWRRHGNAVMGTTELAAVAYVVADGYSVAGGPVSLRAVSQRLRLPEAVVRRLTAKLIETGFLARVAPEGKPVKASQESYLPAKPPQAVLLADLMKLGELSPAGPGGSESRPVLLDAGVTAALDQMRKLSQDAFANRTLADLVGEKEKCQCPCDSRARRPCYVE